MSVWLWCSRSSIIPYIFNKHETRSSFILNSLSKFEEWKGRNFIVGLERHLTSLRHCATALNHLEPGKYPGLDSICPEFKPQAGSALKTLLCNFLTSCLRQLTVTIPKIWRRALVAAIPKPVKPLVTQRVIALYLYSVPSPRVGLWWV